MKRPSTFPITLQQIRDAQLRIAPFIRKTPLIRCEDLSTQLGASISFKLENLQITGSFKLRGATYKILSLSDAERERGVITVSSGNHGRAVSFAAGKLGLYALICMSETVPANKVHRIKSLGAEVVTKGATYDEAEAHALNLQAQKHLTMVHPFDDPDIIAGQGTIGLEIFEQNPIINTVLIPLSGGGLISGIALALKSLKPDIHLIGVTMERGPAMIESLKAGKVVGVVEQPTLADALVGGIGSENAYTFQIVRQLVDETILVSEEEIAAAMAYAFHQENLVVEGGGAVGLAALLSGKVHDYGKNIVVVISGGNVECQLLCSIIQKNNHPSKSMGQNPSKEYEP